MLGILIPPSVATLVYGIITETNIGQLSGAGLLPNMVAVTCYIGAVVWTVWRDLMAGRGGPRTGWPDRIRSLAGVWGVIVLFAVIAVGRQRWLFIGHPEAGWRSAVIYSIIVSCRRRGINPQDYLTDVLARLPSTTISRVGELTLANWKPTPANTS